MNVRVLTIRFSNELRHQQVSQFRGAVIAALNDKRLLFHNHNEQGLRYAYPLIQYKVLGGKAAIVAAGEGIDQLAEFFTSGNFDLTVGGRAMHLEVDQVLPLQYQMQVWDQLWPYRVLRWLPLNSEHYRQYQSLDSLPERMAMLQDILRGNILAMGKGLGVRFDREVVVSLTALDPPRVVPVKGTPVMSFNAQMRCNVNIPQYLGLGKHASLGHGMVLSPEELLPSTNEN
ncbi:MAG: hypothetical protein IJM58_07755 [Muribaculaceae bacterium]|nr:hypothetical protein [Muribaculaceae bacterium]